jgi:hypothetical protein
VRQAGLAQRYISLKYAINRKKTVGDIKSLKTSSYALPPGEVKNHFLISL